MTRQTVKSRRETKASPTPTRESFLIYSVSEWKTSDLSLNLDVSIESKAGESHNDLVPEQVKGADRMPDVYETNADLYLSTLHARLGSARLSRHTVMIQSGIPALVSYSFNVVTESDCRFYTRTVLTIYIFLPPANEVGGG